MTPPAEKLADALANAHRKLLKDLGELDHALRGGVRPEAVVPLLEKARGDVAEHFRLEEAGGYLGDVTEREPQASRHVQELRADHRRLLTQLDDLVARGQAQVRSEGEFVQQIRDWVLAVRKHEREENLLVQDAFNCDLSAED